MTKSAGRTVQNPEKQVVVVVLLFLFLFFVVVVVFRDDGRLERVGVSKCTDNYASMHDVKKNIVHITWGQRMGFYKHMWQKKKEAVKKKYQK